MIYWYIYQRYWTYAVKPGEKIAYLIGWALGAFLWPWLWDLPITPLTVFWQTIIFDVMWFWYWKIRERLDIHRRINDDQ